MHFTRLLDTEYKHNFCLFIRKLHREVFWTYCHLTIVASNQTYKLSCDHIHMHTCIFASILYFYINDLLHRAVVSHPGINKYVADE